MLFAKLTCICGFVIFIIFCCSDPERVWVWLHWWRPHFWPGTILSLISTLRSSVMKYYTFKLAQLACSIGVTNVVEVGKRNNVNFMWCALPEWCNGSSQPETRNVRTEGCSQKTVWFYCRRASTTSWNTQLNFSNICHGIVWNVELYPKL